MASFEKHVKSKDISNRIYEEIMSIPGLHPHGNKRAGSAKCASTHVSFSSPGSNTRSSPKMSQQRNFEAYSDYDIIKSRSWSGSKLKGSNIVNSSTPGKAENLPHSLSASPAPFRSTVSSPAPDRSTVVTPGLPTGRRLQSPRVVPASPTNSTTGSSKGRVPQHITSRGSQVDRLHQEWAALEHCRTMKRASEMIQHRMDPMYQLSGSNVPLLQRYHVDESELQRLRDMAETSRILQTDLKRIKFPYTGPRTPRRDRHQLSRGKSQLTSGGSIRTVVDEKADNSNVETQQTDNLETLGKAIAAPDQLYPSSPMSTPETTPRAEGEASQEEEGEMTLEENEEQGEVSVEDSTEQKEANDDEEE